MIKPDGIIWSSLFPSYINTDTVPGSFTITGIVADGTDQVFGVVLPYPQGSNWIDVFISNNVTGSKIWLNSVIDSPFGAYDYADTEFVTTILNFDGDLIGNYSPGNVAVAFDIANNSGADITLITQTVTVTMPVYQIPF